MLNLLCENRSNLWKVVNIRVSSVPPIRLVSGSCVHKTELAVAESLKQFA